MNSVLYNPLPWLTGDGDIVGANVKAVGVVGKLFAVAVQDVASGCRILAREGHIECTHYCL